MYRVEWDTPGLLDAIAAGRLTSIALHLPAADLDQLGARLADPDDPLDLPQLDTIGTAVTTAITGWAAPAAIALAQAAGDAWAALDGRAALAGADLLSWPARRVLNAVYALRIEGADPADKAKLDAALATPGTGPGTGPGMGPGMGAVPRTQAPPRPAATPERAPTTTRRVPPPGFTVSEQDAGFRAAMATIGAAGAAG